jgi:hypothetical protein
MNLELKGVRDVGDLNRERVVLRATQDADIGRFAIFKCRTTSDDGVAAGYIPAAYWFPDKKVKSGDWVVLYTKEGTRSEKAGDNGNTYFYYWGRKDPQWNGYIAALVSTSTWEYSKLVKAE